MMPQQMPFQPQMPFMPQQQMCPPNIPGGFGGFPMYGGIVSSTKIF
jgi:hypothetical protein